MVHIYKIIADYLLFINIICNSVCNLKVFKCLVITIGLTYGKICCIKSIVSYI